MLRHVRDPVQKGDLQAVVPVDMHPQECPEVDLSVAVLVNLHQQQVQLRGSLRLLDPLVEVVQCADSRIGYALVHQLVVRDETEGDDHRLGLVPLVPEVGVELELLLDGDGLHRGRFECLCGHHPLPLGLAELGLLLRQLHRGQGLHGAVHEPLDLWPMQLQPIVVALLDERAASLLRVFQVLGLAAEGIVLQALDEGLGHHLRFHALHCGLRGDLLLLRLPFGACSVHHGPQCRHLFAQLLLLLLPPPFLLRKSRGLEVVLLDQLLLFVLHRLHGIGRCHGRLCRRRGALLRSVQPLLSPAPVFLHFCILLSHTLQLPFCHLYLPICRFHALHHLRFRVIQPTFSGLKLVPGASQLCLCFLQLLLHILQLLLVLRQSLFVLHVQLVSHRQPLLQLLHLRCCALPATQLLLQLHHIPLQLPAPGVALCQGSVGTAEVLLLLLQLRDGLIVGLVGAVQLPNDVLVLGVCDRRHLLWQVPRALVRGGAPWRRCIVHRRRCGPIRDVLLWDRLWWGRLFRGRLWRRSLCGCRLRGRGVDERLWGGCCFGCRGAWQGGSALGARVWPGGHESLQSIDTGVLVPRRHRGTASR
mmetsp:Transcript_5921/g.10911  ORF Transcript_5921/g.10911 Transcript_5921/m.10911 type:complete len:588 (-) Transcript_5921:309-2072(-)